MHFHGSYLSTDVNFLLNIKNHQEISIEEKEDLLLNHNVHYSETLTKEMDIEDEYMSLFYTYHELNKSKICYDILNIANHLSKNKNKVLVSLARAGTPYGVILKRILSNLYFQNIEHYSISIIKDRGIDLVAINYILEKHGNNVELLFVDGWTGLGNISQELSKYMAISFQDIKYKFVSISDIAGVSDICSSREDYVIPSCMLNATISGLISRTLINTDLKLFHSVKYFIEKEKNDYSLWYINELENEIMKIYENFNPKSIIAKTKEYRTLYLKSLSDLFHDFNLNNTFTIKPGIGETIRCLIRRTPEIVLIKNSEDLQIKPIIYLCEKKKIKYRIVKNMELKCVGIIKNKN
jgi:hypothetical protein